MVTLKNIGPMVIALLTGCGAVANHADVGAHDAALPGDARVPGDVRVPSDAAADAHSRGDAGQADCDSGSAGVQCLAVATPAEVMEFVAVDDRNVYWSATGPGVGAGAGGVLVRVSRSGGAAVTLAPAFPVSIATDGTDLFWATQSPSAIMKVPVGGGTSVTVASVNTPECIAVDDSSVYWTDGSSVQKVPA